MDHEENVILVLIETFESYRFFSAKSDELFPYWEACGELTLFQTRRVSCPIPQQVR
jgi:hypothetical protein